MNSNRVIIEVLEKHCPTSKLTDEAKRELARRGFRILGYNTRILG